MYFVYPHWSALLNTRSTAKAQRVHKRATEREFGAFGVLDQKGTILECLTLHTFPDETSLSDLMR